MRWFIFWKMSKKEHVFGVTLLRQSKNTPWGLTIVGGADLGTPIIVTRVSFFGSFVGVSVYGDVLDYAGDASGKAVIPRWYN